MRTSILAIGLLLLFAGLFLISLSRTPTNVPQQDRPIIKVGEKDSTEIADVYLVNNEKFYVSYIGGGRYLNPDDIFVNIVDPLGNETTLSYTEAGPVSSGIVANYTGLYKIQMGAPGLINPDLPFFMRVGKIIDHVSVEYPNSKLLPIGLSILAVGGALSVLGVLLRKRKIPRDKTRR